MSNKADAPHSAAASICLESTTISFMRTGRPLRAARDTKSIFPPKILSSATTESPRGFAATILSRMASKCAAFWLRIVGDANLSSETTSEGRAGELETYEEHEDR